MCGATDVKAAEELHARSKRHLTSVSLKTAAFMRTLATFEMVSQDAVAVRWDMIEMLLNT